MTCPITPTTAARLDLVASMWNRGFPDVAAATLQAAATPAGSACDQLAIGHAASAYYNVIPFQALAEANGAAHANARAQASTTGVALEIARSANADGSHPAATAALWRGLELAKTPGATREVAWEASRMARSSEGAIQACYREVAAAAYRQADQLLGAPETPANKR